MKIPKIKLDVKRLYRAARVFEAEKRPQILAGMGVAGFWGAMWWTYRNAPSVEILAQDLKHGNLDKEEKKETVIDICKWSAGPVLLGVASSAAVIGSTSISSKRIAALSAVCTATQSTLDAYREKVKEGLLGEQGAQKDQKVMNEIAKDRLENVQATPETVIYSTGEGETLCLDPWTELYFRSSPEAVKRAFNELSRTCQLDGYVSLTDLYGYLGIPATPKLGDAVGWTLDHWSRGVIDISFTATVNRQQQPVLVLEYDLEVLPHYRGAKSIG